MIRNINFLFAVTFLLPAIQALSQQISELIPDVDEDLSIFLNAFNEAGISSNSRLRQVIDSGEYTLFAPTNAAFLFLRIPIPLFQPRFIKHLENLLLFHITPDIISPQDFSSREYTTTMLNGEKLKINGNNRFMNLTHYVPSMGSITTDVLPETIQEADGVVYKINGVLLPSFLKTTIIDLKYRIEGFSIFAELVTIALQKLSLPPKIYITVLAPTDQAFMSLGDEILNQLRDPDDLTLMLQVLSNHVFLGVVSSIDLIPGETLTSVGGKTMTVSVDEVSGGISVGEAKIVQADIVASDGIVHTVSNVMLKKPVPSKATSSPTENPTTSKVTTSNPTIRTTQTSTVFTTIPPSSPQTTNPTTTARSDLPTSLFTRESTSDTSVSSTLQDTSSSTALVTSETPSSQSTLTIISSPTESPFTNAPSNRDTDFATSVGISSSTCTTLSTLCFIGVISSILTIMS